MYDLNRRSMTSTAAPAAHWLDPQLRRTPAAASIFAAVTFAGIETATAQSHFTYGSGVRGDGTSYLLVEYA